MKAMKKIPLAIVVASIMWPVASIADDAMGEANWKVTGIPPGAAAAALLLWREQARSR